jgi:hypothetical protein
MVRWEKISVGGELEALRGRLFWVKLLDEAAIPSSFGILLLSQCRR